MVELDYKSNVGSPLKQDEISMRILWVDSFGWEYKFTDMGIFNHTTRELQKLAITFEKGEKYVYADVKATYKNNNTGKVYEIHFVFDPFNLNVVSDTNPASLDLQTVSKEYSKNLRKNFAHTIAGYTDEVKKYLEVKKAEKIAQIESEYSEELKGIEEVNFAGSIVDI